MIGCDLPENTVVLGATPGGAGEGRSVTAIFTASPGPLTPPPRHYTEDSQQPEYQHLLIIFYPGTQEDLGLCLEYFI